MAGAWVDLYLDVWCHHAEAGGEGGVEALNRLLALMVDDVRYEDVPSAAVFVGHQGIAEMAAGAHQLSADMSFDVLQRVSGAGTFAFEVVCRGTNTGDIGPLPASGRPFSFRTVSIGEVSEDGRVVSQRDYWDLGGLLGQLGATS